MVKKMVDLDQSVATLRQLLRFRPSEGQIWLGEHRMVLLHADYLRGLREELVSTLGRLRAQGLLYRMGFASGKADAALVRSLLPDLSLPEMMQLGPEMHGLEGLVVGSVESVHFDVAGGHYDAKASWQSSWESEAQLERFGEAPEPSCYSQTGYASGYVSALMGFQVVFKEVACLSCGANKCQIVGRAAADWGEDDPWVRMLRPDDLGSELTELREQVARLEQRLVVTRSQGNLIGSSRKFKEALHLLERAAPKNITVLLLGETGVGKEAFARWLHANSSRSAESFIAVNCGALPEDLIESELFGAEAGAFTGAKASRPGRFERADGGTIFLDELGELTPAAQVKLLRVLQEGEIERLGSTSTKKVNVRVVAATNVDLAEAVERKAFRADLYYRLNSFPVTIAPLRERRADILPLAEAFLATAQQRHDKVVAGFSDMAVRAMVEHDWPGNVRELENLVDRGLLLADDEDEIGVDHLGLVGNEDEADSILDAEGRLSPADRGAVDWIDLSLAHCGDINKVEHALIDRALEKTEGNISAAARILGLSRAQLDYRVRTRGIQQKSVQESEQTAEH
jgi:DNA-binding NtrC family response regulator